MGYQRVRTQCMYISSTARKSSDNIYDFTIDIPDGLLATTNDCAFRVSVQSMNVMYGWYIINAGRNTIALKNLTSNVTTTITIPPGSYNYQVLAAVVQSLYSDFYTVQYVNYTNSLGFYFLQPHQMWFPDNSYQLLGFQNLVYSTSSYGSGYVISGASISYQTNNWLCLKLGGVTPMVNNENIDASDPSGAKISNTILAAPLNTVPFGNWQLFNYTPDAAPGFFISEKNVNQIQLQVTDYFGNLNEDMWDYQVTLAFETHKEGNELDAIAESLQLVVDELKHIGLANYYGLKSSEPTAAAEAAPVN